MTDQISEKPRVSVIIPTRNGALRVQHTIASLARQDFPRAEYEVVLVDNGSTDGTKVAAEEAAHEHCLDLRYVYEPRLGLHNARHAGARNARGEILAFADDDVVCDRAWLRELLAPYDSDRVGCVGGRSIPHWEDPPPPWIHRYPGALALLDLGEEVRELKWPESIYGCNFSIRRDLLFALGGFNPDSFGRIWLGDGEIGLLRKVYRSGWKVIYTPRAVVWHRIPRDRFTLSYMRLRFVNQGAADSYTKYHEKLPGMPELLFDWTVSTIKAFVSAMLAVPGNVRSNGRGYHSLLRASYWWSRATYAGRLLVDPGLRSLVARSNWIDEETGHDA